MKITEVHLSQIQGTLEHEGPFWEERLVRPIDLYPEHRIEGPWDHPVPIAEGRYRVRSIFLEIGADEGLTGLSGPISEVPAFLIDRTLKPMLMGRDPLAVEPIWTGSTGTPSTGARAR